MCMLNRGQHPPHRPPPGNWATDIAGGALFEYSLLSVVLLSSLLAVFLQVLTVKLGIATKRDLAQLCAEVYSPRASAFLWVTAEIAIAACDLAEVIGSAIALQLLFGLPIIWGKQASKGTDSGWIPDW